MVQAKGMYYTNPHRFLHILMRSIVMMPKQVKKYTSWKCSAWFGLVITKPEKNTASWTPTMLQMRIYQPLFSLPLRGELSSQAIPYHFYIIWKNQAVLQLHQKSSPECSKNIVFLFHHQKKWVSLLKFPVYSSLWIKCCSMRWACMVRKQMSTFLHKGKLQTLFLQVSAANIIRSSKSQIL